ncbi:MAG TPA: P-loop NTPase [Clostridia bacterium]|nr:P-loop NTPase [Clostridia bacterium]
MGAIIAISGKAGAGKSTILGNLACVYAHTQATVGVLSCDLRYASLPHVFGELGEISSEKSLGTLFGKSSLKDTFVEYKHVPNLFISAPAPKEPCFSYEPPDEKGIVNFLELLESTYDYTIIEAGDIMFNHFSAQACIKADVLINVVEASLQGVAWEQSSYEMLTMYHTPESIINVLNEPHGPFDTHNIEQHLGHKVDVYIRYARAISNSTKKGLPVLIDANAGFGVRRFGKSIAALRAEIGGLM